MQPHQERVVSEKAKLDDMREKLSKFFDSIIYQDLPDDERARLSEQYHHMNEYSRVLGERIAAFPNDA